jgi:hypothetical protein
LLKLASWISGNTGLITVAQVIEESGAKAIKLQLAAQETLQKEMAAYDLGVFPLVVTSKNFELGLDMLVQAAGIGPLQTNTILFGWLSAESNKRPHIRKILYERRLKRVFKQGRNIVILDAKENHWQGMLTIPESERRIDVWWWDDATGRLMLLLAHQISRSEDWNDARIRVLSAQNEAPADTPTGSLEAFLEDVRITAEPVELQTVDANTVIQHSADASLVLCPFQIKGERAVGPFGQPASDLIERLPSVALVLAAEDIDLGAEPEDGKAGEMASLLDHMTDAQKKAAKAEKEAQKASQILEKVQNTLSESKKTDPQIDEIKQVLSEVSDAEAEAQKAARRAAKAKVMAQQAAQEASDAGVKLTENQAEKIVSADGPEEKASKLP